MIIVDVISLRKIEPIKLKTICQLAWDEKRNRIKILKGKKVGKRILKEKFLDKRWHWSEKAVYLSADQGEDFIRDLCYGLAGSRVWASKAYEGIEE
jgi:hypothetical protein